MPKVTIDGREVEVPRNVTILDAAQRLGIDIPTLCFVEGYKPSTSCMVCMVKIVQPSRLVPACGTPALDGMVVETTTEEVRNARKLALELLLGDHAGDCMAPCQSICPAHMDVPTMIRQISAGKFHEAIATVKSRIALPGVLGRICPMPCEKGCRRAGHGGSVSVCLLKQAAADFDLEQESGYLPKAAESSGKRVAIVGSGPSGLAAAYYLLDAGHACTLFDDHPEPGGMLRYGIDEEHLPRWVLDGEIDAIRRLGAEFRLGTRIGVDVAFDDIVRDYDAVLLAAGEMDATALAGLQLPGGPKKVGVDPRTFESPWPGVFAVGGILRKSHLTVRSVAEGRAAATSISQYLAGSPVTGERVPFNHRLLTITPIEVTRLSVHGSGEHRTEPVHGALRGFSAAEAMREAERCVGCDCRKLADCRLRIFAEEYGADPARFRGERRQIEIQHQEGGVIFEVGKCISCGLCIQAAERAQEPLGLAFIGRGFNVRIGVPFNGTIEEGLKKVAAECIAICPTGALAFADRALHVCGECSESGSTLGT